MVTPADSQDLTVLANVKAELGITTTDEDVNLETWIDQASATVSDYCNRTFGQETDLETFRNRIRLGSYDGLYYGGQGGGFPLGRHVEKIVLRRTPIVSIESVIENDIELTEDVDYEADYTTGILTRLTNDFERRWHFRKLEVTYTAGYELLGTLPIAIERATMTLIKYMRANATSDPFITSEAIPGVRTVQYAVGRFAGSDTWPPQDVVNLIAPYRQVDV